MNPLRTRALLAQRRAAYAALEARQLAFQYQASLSPSYPHDPFGAEPPMRTHTDYLNSVVRLMGRQAQAAANQRASAIQSAQGATKIGLDLTAAVGPLGSALPSPDPIADVLSPPVVQSVTAAFSPAVAAATDGAAGAIAQATGIPTTAVQEGITAAKTAATGAALEATRAAQPASAVPAFDAGVALAAGAAKFGANVPKGLTPPEKASWLVTHGINGATAEVKSAVLRTVAAHPEMVKGAKLAVSGIQRGIHPSLLVDESMNTTIVEFGAIAAFLGAGLGALIAGPWGAVIGAAAAGAGAGLVGSTKAFQRSVEKARTGAEFEAKMEKMKAAASTKTSPLAPVQPAHEHAATGKAGAA